MTKEFEKKVKLKNLIIQKSKRTWNDVEVSENLLKRGLEKAELEKQ